MSTTTTTHARGRSTPGNHNTLTYITYVTTNDINSMTPMLTLGYLHYYFATPLFFNYIIELCCVAIIVFVFFAISKIYTYKKKNRNFQRNKFTFINFLVNYKNHNYINSKQLFPPVFTFIQLCSPLFNYFDSQLNKKWHQLQLISLSTNQPIQLLVIVVVQSMLKQWILFIILYIMVHLYIHLN